MAKRVSLVLVAAIVLILGTSRSAAAQQPEVNPDVYSQLQFRYIGPVGNRATAVAGVPGNPNIYYVGAASGGIFKSTDGGIHWDPVFDSQAGFVNWFAGSGGERSEHRLGGNRRIVHPQPHFGWQRNLQVGRTRARRGR